MAEPACEPHVNMRQATLSAPDLDQYATDEIARAAAHALTADLLPYAAVQLLPLWLAPPERVRALDLPQRNRRVRTEASDFLSAMLVSMRPATGSAA